MTDEELIARLRKRADEERIIQKNNEAVSVALKGQRLLFDQGIRSASNTFAVRLGLEYEKCAENDAKLARDWDEAADRIEALTKQVREMAMQSLSDLGQAQEAYEGLVAERAKVARLEEQQDRLGHQCAGLAQAGMKAEAALDAERAKVAKLVEALSEIFRITPMHVAGGIARTALAEVKGDA